jgi:hypothetical protein
MRQTENAEAALLSLEKLANESSHALPDRWPKKSISNKVECK